MRSMINFSLMSSSRRVKGVEWICIMLLIYILAVEKGGAEMKWREFNSQKQKYKEILKWI